MTIPDYIETDVPIPDKGRETTELSRRLHALAQSPIGSSVVIRRDMAGPKGAVSRAFDILVFTAARKNCGPGAYRLCTLPDGSCRVWKIAERPAPK